MVQEFGNDDRAARDCSKRIKKGSLQVAWAGGLGKIGNKHEKEALGRAHALFYKSLRELGGNESKMKVVYGKIEISFFVRSAMAAKYTLEEKVLREKAGISNLMLLPQSVLILVKFFSRELPNQADVRVTVFDSIVTEMYSNSLRNHSGDGSVCSRLKQKFGDVRVLHLELHQSTSRRTFGRSPMLLHYKVISMWNWEGCVQTNKTRGADGNVWSLVLARI